MFDPVDFRRQGSEIFRHRDHAVDRRFANLACFSSQISFSAWQGSEIRQTQDVSHRRILDRRDMGFGFIKQTINAACVTKSNKLGKTIESTQTTMASNEPRDGSMDPICLSLDELEEQLRVCVRSGGVMIYWSHRKSTFDYLIAEDNAQCKQEIRNMRKHFREGKIVDLKAGEEYEVKALCCILWT